MRTFVLMRQESYAAVVAKALCGIVRQTESELLGAIPQEGDRFIIDGHYTGVYADLEGIKVTSKLVNFITDCNIQIEIWSWLPEHYIRKNYNFPYSLLDQITFKQLPYEND